MASRQNNKGLLASLDWFTVFIYIALLAMGWMSVCGACYDFEQAGNFLSLDTRSGMQLVWIGSSFILGFLILSTDDRIIESFSYLIYIFFIAILFVTPFLAHDIKGSMSWIKIGAFSIQPAEFAKFGTALCVAKVMSSYNFNMGRWRDFLLCIGLIMLPVALIIRQKETGSALVYLSFFFMMYREGMPGSILLSGLSAVIYFVVGVKFESDPFWGINAISTGHFCVFLLIFILTLCLLHVYTEEKGPLWRILGYGGGAMVVSLAFSKFVIPFDVTKVQLLVCVLSAFYLLYLALRERIMRYFYIALFALGSLTFFFSANYVLDEVMRQHQRDRIHVLLGMLDDPTGKGYNVIQAKIAIGSGGLKGKGFLNGTQTKLKYVPEQDTDFIFCTVGEEEGFMGSATVLLLFLALILRLIHVAERQPYAFGRIYGYCVAGVFFFHLVINVGMVLGLAPVIGIPLPFFSYGGSSLWGFTILLFIFLRIDAGRTRMQH